VYFSVYVQDALEVARAEAVAAGAYGGSTARSLKDASLPAPPGATWRTVYVRCLRGGGGGLQKQMRLLDYRRGSGG
jgi:hypothetical protein